MSDAGREQRAQESGVVGHSYDSDDRIEDLDIYEALVNPHDAEAGATKGGGAGGPGMMPMGGGAGGGSGKAGTATGGTGAGSATAARGTSAAGAGTAASGIGAPGFAGASSGVGGITGPGGSGPGGLGGLSTAGLGSGGLGVGGLGSGGSNFSMPTLGTSAAGVSDPSTAGFEVPPYTATAPGGFTVPSPGTNPGSGTLPSVPSVPGTGPGTGGLTAPTLPNPSTGIKPPSVPSGGGSGIPNAGGPGGGVGGAGGAPSTGSLAVAPVQASPEMLHKEAQHWDDTAKEYVAAVADPINALAPLSVDFGMMSDAFPPYSDLLNRMKAWSTQAGAEFTNISDALQSASGDYQDTEELNASESTTIHAGSPTVAV